MSDSLKKLRSLGARAHLADARIKQRYVTTLFEAIVPSYDRFTRGFSLGMDAGWKRDVAARACAVLPPGGRLADVATGTGDIARAVVSRRPDVRATGLDVAHGMIAVARASTRAVRFGVADAMQLPLRAASHDVVTVGYGFRNVPDPAGALREAHRVLRPGGSLITLDFYLPETRAWRAVFVRYLRWTGAAAGLVLHATPAAYRYIADSLERWMTWPQFSRVLTGERFAVVRARPRLGGGICVHEARRE